jgi:hypothetical protein
VGGKRVAARGRGRNKKKPAGRAPTHEDWTFCWSFVCLCVTGREREQ